MQAAYVDEVQAALAGTAYNAGGCHSYYIDANGRNSFSWPWSTNELVRRVSRFDAADVVTTAHVTAEVPRMSRYPKIDLDDALVAITGAARGIGLATAKAFVDAGARVAIGDLDVDLIAQAAEVWVSGPAATPSTSPTRSPTAHSSRPPRNGTHGHWTFSSTTPA